MNLTVNKSSGLNGEIVIPSDKSISHRSAMFLALTGGKAEINNFSTGADCISTLNIIKALGCEAEFISDKHLVVDSKNAFKKDLYRLDCGNSGTSMRLFSGILASRPEIEAELYGDESLSKRPMRRIIVPLELMGAKIKHKDFKSPLTIFGKELFPIDYKTPMASAQVKSCILLAGLNTYGETRVTEPYVSRDHTERMLRAFGIKCENNNGKISVTGGTFSQSRVDVPSDFSSAAFFIGAGLIFEGSEIVIENCGLNPSRIGLLQALKELGVNIEYEVTSEEVEPVGNIYVKPAQIKGGKISGEIIANMIDEIPVLAMIGLFGQAPLEIRDAKELRVKESDRIAALINNFKALGAEIEEYEDGLKIYPLTKEPEKATLLAYDDHRISMVNIILAKKFGVKVLMDNIASLDVSYPDFIGDLLSLEVK